MAVRGRVSADECLAAELAAGRTVKAAAAAAGVGERTAFRRLADPTFTARVTALRGEMIGTAAGRLAGGMTEAADVLRVLLASPAEPVRLRAAAKLIELGVKVVELADLERRLTDLERQMAAEKQDSTCAPGTAWPHSPTR